MIRNTIQVKQSPDNYTLMYTNKVEQLTHYFFCSDIILIAIVEHNTKKYLEFIAGVINFGDPMRFYLN